MESLRRALWLLWSLDSGVIECIETSLICSVTATGMALALGVPLAVLLGRARFTGRRTLLVVAHTGMAVPTVVIGLLAYALLSRTGPLGMLGGLYTRGAIIAGEFALGLPIIVAMFSSAVSGLDIRLEMTARTLGAGRLRVLWTIVAEARIALVAAAMAAFGRLCSELGVAMMVGGNIEHYTRTMTTAIAVETSGGEFEQALALGLILVLIALGINVFAQMLGLAAGGRYADVL